MAHLKSMVPAIFNLATRGAFVSSLVEPVPWHGATRLVNSLI